MTRAEEVLRLSRRLGDPSHAQAILAEGNVSGRQDSESFWIKASGFNLGSLKSEQLLRVNFAAFQDLPESLSDFEIKELLKNARSEEGDLLPSVETFMHAALLRLPLVDFVGHTHPTSLLSLLCLDQAEELSRRRLFPDEVVCCGPASAFVPYADPGLPLARKIHESVRGYIMRWEQAPKTIWLANHGLIALGRTPAEVESACLMAEKAARVWLEAIGTGLPIRELTVEQILRIHTRPDEHYRQKILAAITVQSAG